MSIQEEVHLKVKHMAGKHNQKPHGNRYGGSSTSRGSSNKTSSPAAMMKGIAQITGREFNPDTAKKMGNKTSHLANAFVKGAKQKKVLADLDSYLTEQGLTKKAQGRTKNETMYGNNDASTVVSVTKKSQSVLIEFINTD